MGVNKVILVGYLGDNPEMRYTPDGKGVATFNIATNYRWTDDKGNKHQGVDWHRVKAWGKKADICAEHLEKGSHVYVEGKLKHHSWEKDGVRRYMTEVVVQCVEFLGPKDKKDSMPEVPAAHQDDDIPF